nr:hypothetical protein [Tanacetum cinerariifolium]
IRGFDMWDGVQGNMGCWNKGVGTVQVSTGVREWAVREPSYNQNYDDNYYPHESPSYPCCDYCGGSHETFQCQPNNQNVDFSSSDLIQTPQYPDVNPPSPEISNEENFQAKGDLMKSIQTFLERFNCIPFEEKPQILFQTYETFFSIQCSHPEDSNELFQELLKDLKELAEYDQSTSTDRPIFLNGDEDHPVQNRESPENSSEENVVSKTNQEPPQDSDIQQLIEECSIEVPEEQKQKMENTMFELLKFVKKKSFFEVKNVVEQPAERGNRSIQSLQNFRVVHKSSISFKDTSQISLIHSVAPIQSTKEPEHLLNVCSPVFTTFSNLLFKDNEDLDSSKDESLFEDVPAEEFKIYSNPLFDKDEINSDKLDPHCFNVESDFVESLLNHDTFIDFSSKFDFSDDVLPPGMENFADDPEGDIHFLEELLIDNSILSHASFDSSFEDNPSIPRPPPKPPDVETDAGEEIAVVMINKDKFDDDYQIFMFDKVFSLLSAESEDTIFDPGLSPGD